MPDVRQGSSAQASAQRAGADPRGTASTTPVTPSGSKPRQTVVGATKPASSVALSPFFGLGLESSSTTVIGESLTLSMIMMHLT